MRQNKTGHAMTEPDLHSWISARLAALPEDAFDSADDWPENQEDFDAALPGAFVATLEPIVIAMEYRDSHGEISERKVTLLQMRGSAEGALHLAGRCHMRNARRTFRVDRILSMSGLPDMPSDATPENLLAALADLAIETDWHTGAAPPARAARTPRRMPETLAPASRAGQPADWLFRIIRRHFRPEIRLLAFLAKADGELHPAELGVIDAYCAALAEDHARADWKAADSAALAAYCRQLQFSRETELRCLEKIQNWDGEMARRFDAAAIALVDADGRRDPAEMRMMRDWRSQAPEDSPVLAQAGPAPARRDSPPGAGAGGRTGSHAPVIVLAAAVLIILFLLLS